MTAIEKYPAVITECALGKSHNKPGIQEPQINEHSTINLETTMPPSSTGSPRLLVHQPQIQRENVKD
jgi:hypothetical protein